MNRLGLAPGGIVVAITSYLPWFDQMEKRKLKCSGFNSLASGHDFSRADKAFFVFPREL
jgi:hypothetical protein